MYLFESLDLNKKCSVTMYTMYVYVVSLVYVSFSDHNQPSVVLKMRKYYGLFIRKNVFPLKK